MRFIKSLCELGLPLALTLGFTSACSDSPTGAGPGGATGSGGQNASGGASSSGGNASSGGNVTSGGAQASGGQSTSGGSTAGGAGNTASGGAPVSGGSNSGGATAGGGAGTSGGAKASGGSVSSGGSTVAGGSNASGGAKASGGNTSSGGMTATGGQGGGGGGPDGTTPGTVVQQGDIAFTKTGGWLEYGFAQWTALSGADGYNVYQKLGSAADSAYVRVDAALVRGTRVDVPGLAGKQAHDLKVVPVTGGSEQAARASVVRVTTLAHDRSGFAFHSSSPNKNANGAYNADGTLKSDALVLYVSEATKDTVTMDVTKGTKTTSYTGVGAIMAARQSAATTVPLAIRILGRVMPPAGVDSLKLLNLKTNSNITVEGIGTDAECNGWGLNIRTVTNVEVRNLAFSLFEDDAVSIQADNNNIWIHNVDFMIGANGGGDKELGDGSCDIKDNSSYITVAYNHFIGTGKSSLTGQGDSAEFFVSFHHNFFDASHSRHPRVRWGTVHVYNNYYKGITTYGAAASEHSNLFVQNNVFENVVRPMIIASQGHDFKDLVPAGQTPGAHESMLSGEPGGAIKQQGNEFDAVSASWFNATVDTGNGSSSTYNNFDANFGTAYPLALDTAAAGKARTLSLAGRLN